MSIGQGYLKWLTREEECALTIGCEVLIDAFFDEYCQIESWNPESVFVTRLGKHLPRHFSENYTPLLYKQFGICIITVAQKLAQPTPLPLVCVAEELAMLAIVEEARAALKEECTGESKDEAPLEFQVFLDKYAPSSNVCRLFDPSASQQDISHTRKKTHHAFLSFEHWFRPFSRTRRVHPYCSSGETGMRVGQAYQECLRPLEQEALDAGVAILIDEIFEDLAQQKSWEPEDIAWTTLGKHLPPHYLPKYTHSFLKQFSVCIITVAWKLAQTRHLRLSSLAEEMAVHAIIEEAREYIAIQLEEEGGQELTEDEAFEDFREYYFEDEDFLFLFDNFYDGIETSSVGQLLQMTSLAFADWFRPFTDESSRIAHPYVYGKAT